ncbi:hypothetical protein PpBr36_02460 [Pyricularia pennisetigena]|uniref:hypothetical protein n=1 Tax=Pyricularia pennisetigena TaxID=1578925 RepID=UPI0011512816|nr:hypothetical protein PpBr36_02460 [Pyricularia pennisetigena]TLS30454.1 hypothetical protein PpBr36_02460 [Pyricularia pennisetigena]
MSQQKYLLLVAILGAVGAAAQDGLLDSCDSDDLFYNLSFDENIDAAIPFCSSFLGVPTKHTTTVTVASTRPVPTTTETYTVTDATTVQRRQAPPTALPRQEDGEEGQLFVHEDSVEYPSWLGRCPAESIAAACEQFEILPGPDATVTKTVLTPSFTETLTGAETAVARLTKMYARRTYTRSSPAHIYNNILFAFIADSEAGADGEYPKAQAECQRVCKALDECKVYFVVALRNGFMGRNLNVYCEISDTAFDARTMRTSNLAIFSVGYELVGTDTS